MSLLELISRQNSNCAAISRAITNFKKTGISKRTKGYVMGRMSNISDIWKCFMETQYNIEQASAALPVLETEKIPYIANDVCSEMEETYFDFMGILQDSLNAFDSSYSSISNTSDRDCDAGNSAAHSSNIRLPAISIPTFSGNYLTWRSFHDLFTSLVHCNSRLSPVQKLHYLKTSLSGEAEQLLRQYPITDSNYEIAWKALVERYDNKRMLVNAQLKTLCNLPTVNYESAKILKTLLDTVSQALAELEALAVPTNGWDPLIVYQIVQKLPNETLHMWEQELKGKQDLPTISELKTFLESRFRILEAIQRTAAPSSVSSKNSPHFTPKTLSHHATSETRRLCKESHPICRCQQLVKGNVSGRPTTTFVKSTNATIQERTPVLAQMPHRAEEANSISSNRKIRVPEDIVLIPAPNVSNDDNDAIQITIRDQADTTAQPETIQVSYLALCQSKKRKQRFTTKYNRINVRLQADGSIRVYVNKLTK